MRQKLVVNALAVLFVTLVATSGAEAQLLNGKWVKLTVNSAGRSFNNATNKLGGKIVFKGTCYMRIVWNVTTLKHEGRVACIWADGNWYDTQTLFVFDALANGDFWGWEQWGRFFNRDAHDIWGWIHIFISPVVKKGVLTQIQVTSLGRITDGNIVGTDTWGPYAPYNIKGTAVPESQVPPAVRALLP
jgi:hypothetical protein